MLYRYSGDKYTREVVFVNIRRYSEIDAVNITICRERPSDFHTCVSLYHAAHKLLYQIHSYQMLKSIIVHQNCEHKQFFYRQKFFFYRQKLFHFTIIHIVTCLKIVIFYRNKGLRSVLYNQNLVFKERASKQKVNLASALAVIYVY